MIDDTATIQNVDIKTKSQYCTNLLSYKLCFRCNNCLIFSSRPRQWSAATFWSTLWFFLLWFGNCRYIRVIVGSSIIILLWPFLLLSETVALFLDRWWVLVNCNCSFRLVPAWVTWPQGSWRLTLGISRRFFYFMTWKVYLCSFFFLNEKR